MQRSLPRRWTSTRLLPTLVAAATLLAACGDADDPVPSATTAPGVTDAPGESSAGPPSTAAKAVPANPDLALVPVAALDQPIALAARAGTDDLYVAERAGRVRWIQRTVDRAADAEQVRLVTEPVLDLTSRVDTSGERGLLGLAFSPDGSELYVDWVDRQGLITIAAYPMRDPGHVAADQARVLLTVPHGQFSNHNGGDVVVGPDGMLYVAVGDGGGGGDPNGNAQNRTTLLGKVLRIDPRPGGGRPYTIPPDNPFAAGEGGARPEIWIYGVRNPWRIAFDRETRDLWVADVGQNEVEEIDLLPATAGAGRGANLGWNLREGDQRFRGDPPPGAIEPVHTYRHGNGACSVTGGYRYRGTALPALAGTYLFTDYCGGRISGLRPDGDRWAAAPLPVTRQVRNVVSFGQDGDGELYVLEQGGAVSRLQPASGGRKVTTRS